MREELAGAGVSRGGLKALAKGDRREVRIARRLRMETPMTRQWLARTLEMGSASYLSGLLRGVDDSKL